MPPPPAREETPGARFSALLSRFPAGIVTTVKGCLPRLRRAFAGGHELVYDYPHSLVVAFGPSERGWEAIVSLAVSPNGVRLYFDRSLPDPKRLLEGSGRKVRSVTIDSAADLDRADIRALIRAAIAHSGAAFPRGRSTRVVLKAKSKKKGARRTGRA